MYSNDDFYKRLVSSQQAFIKEREKTLFSLPKTPACLITHYPVITDEKITFQTNLLTCTIFGDAIIVYPNHRIHGSLQIFSNYKIKTQYTKTLIFRSKTIMLKNQFHTFEIIEWNVHKSLEEGEYYICTVDKTTYKQLELVNESTK